MLWRSPSLPAFYGGRLDAGNRQPPSRLAKPTDWVGGLVLSSANPPTQSVGFWSWRRPAHGDLVSPHVRYANYSVFSRKTLPIWQARELRPLDSCRRKFSGSNLRI